MNKRRPGRVRGFFSFLSWTLLPILVAGVGTLLGLWAAADPTNAPGIRIWALVVAIGLVLLLIAKAVRDHRWGLSIRQARYDTVEELHNRLGPALDLLTEMALIDTTDVESRRQVLRVVASQCCSAVVSMTPESADVRAVVFELRSPDEIRPLAKFGRKDDARTFLLSSPAGQEVSAYLEQSNSRGELYDNIHKKAPPHYEGDVERYRTFVRAPIKGNGVVFGMLAVDAPKAGSLTKGDVLLAEFVAAQLGGAFAIAAG